MSSFRARFAAASVAKRVPAHITLLMPFVPAGMLEASAVDAARDHFASMARLEAELVGIGRFEKHVWLVPEPRAAFVELIRATCGRFPESPYGGEFPDPVPHLTIGQAGEDISVGEILSAVEANIAPHLPVRFHLSAATLLEEQADGTWASTAEFPFQA